MTIDIHPNRLVHYRKVVTATNQRAFFVGLEAFAAELSRAHPLPVPDDAAFSLVIAPYGVSLSLDRKGDPDEILAHATSCTATEIHCSTEAKKDICGIEVYGRLSTRGKLPADYRHTLERLGHIKRAYSDAYDYISCDIRS